VRSVRYGNSSRSWDAASREPCKEIPCVTTTSTVRPAVDFDHGEHFFREADVVLGEPIERPADTGAESRTSNCLPGSTVPVAPSGETDSVVEPCWKAWPMPLATPASSAFASNWPCFETSPSPHACLAVLAGHVALERDIDGGAVARDAGKGLGADVGALRNSCRHYPAPTTKHSLIASESGWAAPRCPPAAAARAGGCVVTVRQWGRRDRPAGSPG